MVANSRDTSLVRPSRASALMSRTAVSGSEEPALRYEENARPAPSQSSEASAARPRSRQPSPPASPSSQSASPSSSTTLSQFPQPASARASSSTVARSASAIRPMSARSETLACQGRSGTAPSASVSGGVAESVAPPAAAACGYECEANGKGAAATGEAARTRSANKRDGFIPATLPPDASVDSVGPPTTKEATPQRGGLFDRTSARNQTDARPVSIAWRASIIF